MEAATEALDVAAHGREVDERKDRMFVALDAKQGDEHDVGGEGYDDEQGEQDESHDDETQDAEHDDHD
ncbi:hypothetical protein LTR86_005971 [Recurvomyces mirabilis]|nr:hypothetical protein LTR86_005971 [Recurvomyces mirabilis]